ncbi:MAG: DUF1446 domain-containing protein [Halanaerobiales bacterium]|nr:DUF1446 domain-containing protein [Halanaerobiales bacterium]
MGKEKKGLKIISPNGHLGFAPTKEESFQIGVAAGPDYYCCDSGSDDIGPAPLGSDTSVSHYKWQKHDLELMLLAARKKEVPMIIGSAGDTGTKSRVDLYVQIIKDLAEEHKLARFKLAYFYSDLTPDYLIDLLQQGATIEPLDQRENKVLADLQKTDRIVAVAGIHPYIKALKMGADVIIGGRSSDCAVFAAPAIFEGYPENLSYYLGKVLECASFCAEPYGAKESVMGYITQDDVKIKALHPKQRCTIASVAGHAMYERANPYYEYFVGGMLDMSQCKYEQYNDKTCRVTDPIFIPKSGQVKVKLEGSGKIGEKFIGIAGVRDPYTIKNIHKVIEWVQEQVEERFAGQDYQLNFRLFGLNGVMGELEPIKETKSHELGIIVEGIAPTREMAEEVTMIGTRQIFYARLPEVKGTAGSAAFILDEVLATTPAYEWTLNHVISVDDPMKFFEVKQIEIGN